MAEPKILRFFLDTELRQSAESGDHNFIGKVVNVAQASGYRVEFKTNSDMERLKSAGLRGYSMFHMDDPFHDRALTFRGVYRYPFWAIERSAKRWQWRVANCGFSQEKIPRDAAVRFFDFWRNRLFNPAGTAPSQDGYVYVPLQGKLLERRSFQTCTPLEMVQAVLHHDSERQVVAALHPKETYTSAEIAELEGLKNKCPRLAITSGNMEKWLKACDYVVTQNSSAGFFGFFFEKPCVLFGQIDFHHIALNVAALGVQDAIAQAPQHTPDYAGYVHWFWQQMSINAGRPDAEDQIRARLALCGLPM